MRRITVFNSAFECVDLILSIGLTGIVLFESVYSPIGWLTGRQWTLLQDIFFLKNGHIVFTYLFLFNTHQGRSWLSQNQNPLFLFRCVFVFFGAMVGALVFTYLPHSAIASFTRLIFIYAGRHHQLQQCRGIQRLYEAKYSSSVGTRTAIAKLLFSLDATIWHGLAISSAMALYISQLRLRTNSIDIPLTTIDMLSRLSIWTCAFFLLLLVARAFFCYEAALGLRSNVRNIRFLSYVLVEHSDVAKFASAALHGVESLGVMNHLDSRTDRILGGKALLSIMTGGLLIVVFLHYPYLLFPDGLNAKSLSWWGILAPILAGFSFVHYFLESQIFSGRLSHSRRYVLSRLST